MITIRISETQIEITDGDSSLIINKDDNLEKTINELTEMFLELTIDM